MKVSSTRAKHRKRSLLTRLRRGKSFDREGIGELKYLGYKSVFVSL